MAIVEALAALVLIAGTAIGVAFGGRWIRGKIRCFTIEGKIERKRKSLDEQDVYIRSLAADEPWHTAKYRKEITVNYKELAAKKREQIRVELEALELEKDRRDFENHMKGDK